MSVQLILYPQNYEGSYNSTITSPSQFIVDGINFNTINTSSSYDSSSANTIIVDTLTNAAPSVFNTWFRFRSTATGTPTLPAEVSGGLTLYSTTTSTLSGVYQKLSNLVVGTTYEIVLDLSTTGTGFVVNSIYNGTTIIAQSIQAANQSQIAYAFTPTTTTPTIVISYFNFVNDNIVINNISVSPQGVVPTNTYTNLQDGQIICDLYEEEDIPLSLSVDDFKNVAEKVQSYSKSFNLPATKRNNQIFDNIFEVTRTDTGLNFNPYVKTKCILKQDGFILFEGYLRLIDIKDKEGEISYNVNLYSEVVALKDTLKGRKFRDLNFDELKHLYDKRQIKRSWNNNAADGSSIDYINPSTSGFRHAYNTLKYPFVDWTHQFTVSGGDPQLPSLETAFRPFIQIKYLIDRLFSDTPFTFTSTFFNTAEFKKLYMDFNWGADANPNSVESLGSAFYREGDPDVYATTGWTNFIWNDVDLPSIAGFNPSDNVFTCPTAQDNSTFNMFYRANVFAKRDADIQFRWLKNGATVIDPSPVISLQGSAVMIFQTNNQGEITSTQIIEGGYYTSPPTITIDAAFGLGALFTTTIDGLGAVDSITIVNDGSGYASWDLAIFNGVNPRYVYVGTVNEILQPTDTLVLQWKSSDTNYIRQNNEPSYNNAVCYNNCAYYSILNVTISLTGMTSDILLQTLRGDLGQWEFLKGIMTMFNLVTMPDPENLNNILIEPYKNVFISNTNSSTTSDLTLAARSIEHDWTDKIDVSEMKLKPLTDLKKTTIFKFVEDDDDYAFTNYKNSVGGHLYGSKVIDASLMFNGLQTVLDGEEVVEAKPFAATVIKALELVYSDFLVPAIYSYNLDDGTSEGFDNSPRIMYNNGVKTLTSCEYHIPAQNGLASENMDTFLQFSHLSQIPVGLLDTDFHFGECQLLIGSGTPNNLYNIYWAPYYDELYNADTKIMTLKVNLSPSDINLFKFTDKVLIKNRVFRVNKINYKPNDLASVEFILIP